MNKHDKNISSEEMTVEKEPTVSVEVEAYAPHQNLSPVDYIMPEVMSNLKAGFRAQVSEFLDKTSPDQYNASFADNIIEKAKAQAILDLQKQRADHVKCIERSISALWKGDEHYYKKLLSDLDEEYQERDAELKRLKKIFHKNTALGKRVNEE